MLAMSKPKTSAGGNGSGRRGFLKGAAIGAAALVAQTPARAQDTQPGRGTAAPSAAALAKETEPVSSSVEVLTADRPGSDFMVDVLKSLGFEYICANPGSSFRALHESIINYGGNAAPEFITCCHEEQSVAMADGYARMEGKPLAVMAHSTVGLQHAAMAIYNCFAARIPAFIRSHTIAFVFPRYAVRAILLFPRQPTILAEPKRKVGTRNSGERNA